MSSMAKKSNGRNMRKSIIPTLRKKSKKQQAYQHYDDRYMLNMQSESIPLPEERTCSDGMHRDSRHCTIDMEVRDEVEEVHNLRGKGHVEERAQPVRKKQKKSRRGISFFSRRKKRSNIDSRRLTHTAATASRSSGSSPRTEYFLNRDFDVFSTCTRNDDDTTVINVRNAEARLAQRLDRIRLKTDDVMIKNSTAKYSNGGGVEFVPAPRIDPIASGFLKLRRGALPVQELKRTRSSEMSCASSISSVSVGSESSLEMDDNTFLRGIARKKKKKEKDYSSLLM